MLRTRSVPSLSLISCPFSPLTSPACPQHADFVLLAGDMFHDNKPSRQTMHVAMNLLREHCLGDDAVFCEVCPCLAPI